MPISLYYTGYQEAIDPESDDYSDEIEEFQGQFRRWIEFLEGIYIIDGDRDGYTMVAHLVLPNSTEVESLLKTQNNIDGFSFDIEIDLSHEYNYYG